MDKQLAFVLSGGGSLGALQVGALYALAERGFEPDLLIGTSIGAANAAFLALHGFSKQSLDLLTAAWHQAAELDLLPANFIWLTLRAMLGRSSNDPSHRIRDFIIAQGFSPDLCFLAIRQPRLVIVSADLNTGKPVLHGESPDDKVLDALLLSTALPPWSMPLKKQGHYLMDGGVISNLPIEPAIKVGATQVIALDILNIRERYSSQDGFKGFLGKLVFAVEKRHVYLELELAEARGIPILYFGLSGGNTVPIWDFKHTDELVAQGYEIAQQVMEGQAYSRFLERS